MAFDVGGAKGGVRPSMNVTPLVDVVLVLLIIFMVVTPLLTKQFRVYVPEKPDETADATPPPTEPPDIVVLSVTLDGHVRINKDDVAETELVPRLQRVFAARDDRTLFFHADDDVPYGRALDVLDLARGGGASTIAMMTDPIAN